MRHWIAGSGMYGCLYDCCTTHTSVSEAADELVERLELGRGKRALLREAQYADLPATTGADYCEIVECDCADVTQHEGWDFDQPLDGAAE